MTKKTDSLTSEKLRKRFKSPFDLVTHAIRLASNEIKRGQDYSGGGEYINCATLVLNAIETDREDTLTPEPTEEEESETTATVVADYPSQKIKTEEPVAQQKNQTEQKNLEGVL